MAEWKDLILAEERSLRIGGKITFGSGLERTLTGSEIASVTIDEGSDGALMPGAVLSASCRADLVNDEGQWIPGIGLPGGESLIGATLTLEIGAGDDEILWKNLGVFQIENALSIESGAVLRISCSDSIASELYEPFADSLAYPATLETLWKAVVGQTRYIWTGSVPNGSALVDAKPDWQNASLRTVMGMVAAAAGCFVCIDRYGSLQLKPVVSARQYAIGPGDYISLERDDAFYGPVDALRLIPVGGAEQIYYADADQSALHVLSVENNPLFAADAPHLDSLARGMLNRVAGYYSEKAEFTWRGDPELCIGDKILLTDALGRSFSGVLSRQSLSFDHSFRSVCSCVLPEKADSGVRRAITPEGGLNAAALTGAINGALLSVGSVTTNKLAAGAVTAEKLAAGAVSANVVEAVAAKLESLTAADIQTDRLASALAAFTVLAAGTAEFDRATVEKLVSSLFNLTGSGVMEEVFIHNLKVAYAQMVSASIGDLVIKASDGSYYRLDVNAEGLVTAASVNLTDGEIAAGEAADGGVILETGLTADQLNTSNLLATHALVNRIDAARIDVDQLFARQAFITSLNTADISSNSYIRQSVVDAVTGEIGQFIRLDENGLHVGERGADGEVLIDEQSVSIALAGRNYSRFAPNYVQFGGTRMYRTADGGMAFKTMEV